MMILRTGTAHDDESNPAWLVSLLRHPRGSARLSLSKSAFRASLRRGAEVVAAGLAGSSHSPPDLAPKESAGKNREKEDEYPKRHQHRDLAIIHRAPVQIRAEAPFGDPVPPREKLPGFRPFWCPRIEGMLPFVDPPNGPERIIVIEVREPTAAAKGEFHVQVIIELARIWGVRVSAQVPRASRPVAPDPQHRRCDAEQQRGGDEEAVDPMLHSVGQSYYQAHFTRLSQSTHPPHRPSRGSCRRRRRGDRGLRRL